MQDQDEKVAGPEDQVTSVTPPLQASVTSPTGGYRLLYVELRKT